MRFRKNSQASEVIYSGDTVRGKGTRQRLQEACVRCELPLLEQSCRVLLTAPQGAAMMCEVSFVRMLA